MNKTQTKKQLHTAMYLLALLHIDGGALRLQVSLLLLLALLLLHQGAHLTVS